MRVKKARTGQTGPEGYMSLQDMLISVMSVGGKFQHALFADHGLVIEQKLKKISVKCFMWVAT